MGHKIAEAIIENGQIKYVNKKLPCGKIKVHLIYDAMEETLSETEVAKIVRETSGIYKGINVKTESRKLRASWERNVHN
ncbi:MAG TPA: hypothetical protein ACFYD6_00400 [Candidatus Brocadiia bacterium]|nr:hypothetical protein [Candidatus Brocadiales bacterium]